ncbi:MAG: hypothetical protein GYA14_05905 [Ignavibacteria bacterium]|nr:hypothetical protein [Ignavibacteria bacterium]
MKKLIALLVVVAFSATLYAQAQPQKKAEPAKPKTEMVKQTEKKDAVTPKVEPPAEKKAVKDSAKKHVESKIAHKKSEVKKEPPATNKK